MAMRVEWVEKRQVDTQIDEPVRMFAFLDNGTWRFYEQEIWDVRIFPVPSTPALLQHLSQLGHVTV